MLALFAVTTLSSAFLLFWIEPLFAKMVLPMLGGSPAQVGHATALAMQGTLGLVCDPLGGLVELPCVFRNATGSASANLLPGSE